MAHDTILHCSCGYEGGLDEYRQGEGDYAGVMYCPECHHPHEMKYTSHNVELVEFKAAMRVKIAKMRVEMQEYKKSREALTDMFLDLYGGMKMIRSRAHEDANKLVKGGQSIQWWADLAYQRAKKLNDVRDFAERLVDQCSKIANDHMAERRADANDQAAEEEDETHTPPTAG